MTCGPCSSGWFRRHRCARRVEGFVGAGTARCWPRSFSWPPRGCAWNQLPPGFGLSGVTAFRRFTEWSEARVWAKLHRLVLDELGARDELDWSRCAIDSVSVRALKGGS